MNNSILIQQIREQVEALHSLCKAHQIELVTAESCTGGMISSFLTEIPGSSSVFLGGFIVYSNQMKTDVLGVQKNTIEGYGAVSKKCGAEMAAQAAKVAQKLSTNTEGMTMGISSTGIAGPDGGTPKKPVGLVHICAASPCGSSKHQELSLQGDRKSIQLQSTLAALKNVIEFIRETNK